MHTAIRAGTAALLATTLVAALSTSPSASASNTFHNASAGVACHPANGAVAAKFTYNLNFLTNGNTTDAYVLCSLPMDDVNNAPAHLDGLMVDVFLPSPGTVACAAQTGYYGGGLNQIESSTALSYTSSVNNVSHQFSFNTLLLHRDGVPPVLTLNCKLPPGARMGLIQRWETPAPPP
jgi:hypothetical protein